jgi:hypothetical protein
MSFRFAIKDMFAITAIAAISYLAGLVVWAADNTQEFAGRRVVFLWRGLLWLRTIRRRAPHQQIGPSYAAPKAA